jgi:hypothetical protein
MSQIEEIDYLEESGPGIPELPEAAAPAPELPPGGDPATIGLPGWEQETIETFLQGTGAGIHMLIGQTEKDWLMTEQDLKRIAPPLTRICNRWEPALRLSPVADPLLVAHGFALYGWRSALERRRALRDGEPEPEGPGYERGPAPVQAVEPEIEPEPDVDVDELEAEPYFNQRRSA